MGRALAFVLLLAGCPPSNPGDGVAPVATASEAAPVAPSAPKDPLAGSIFTKEQVLELFAAEHRAGLPGAPPEALADRDRLLRKHQLLSESGAPVQARVDAYERAIAALAQDEQAWSAYVDTLGPR